MILFIKLLIAHIVADFLLQTDKTIIDKQKKKWKSLKLYLHVAVHGIISIAITLSVELMSGIAIIVLTHLIIDLWKLYVQNEVNKRSIFMIDQALHVFMILVISDHYVPWIYKIISEINLNQIFILILVILLLTTVSSHIIKVIISKWQPENEDEDNDSLTNAGSYIGILERLFVFGFIISNNIQGIGFLLAAKSVFRFGDLKDSVDRKLTEYILIGSLLSFGFAIIFGYTYLELKKII